MEPDRRERWIADLYRPLPGQADKVTQEIVDDEMASFMRLQREV